MSKDNIHYYRIYDDQEDFSYIKSRLTHKEFEEVIKSYEKRRKKYLNCTLMKHLLKSDPEAEFIEVEEISY
jgi:hypothetical protein